MRREEEEYALENAFVIEVAHEGGADDTLDLLCEGEEGVRHHIRSGHQLLEHLQGVQHIRSALLQAMAYSPKKELHFG